MNNEGLDQGDFDMIESLDCKALLCDFSYLLSLFENLVYGSGRIYKDDKDLCLDLHTG